MRFKLLITIFATLFLEQYCFCQEKPRKGEIIQETILILSEPSTTSNAKQIILFEDSVLLILTTIGNFEEVSKAFIKSYRGNRMSKADSVLYNNVLNDSQKSSLVNAQKIESTLKENTYLEYLIVECLEQGKCYIQNKFDKKFTTKVKKQAYRYNCGFDCGDEGRRYLINNQIFFYVVDKII